MINLPGQHPISTAKAFAMINGNVEALQDGQQPKLAYYVARSLDNFVFGDVDWEAERAKFNAAKAQPDREEV